MKTERTFVRRKVATRILLSYLVMLAAFLTVALYSIWASQSAEREASLMRTGYFPLALAVRDTVAGQDTWNTQLNHITAARNPADIRVWFDFATRIGRPKLFVEVRAAISQAFVSRKEVEVRNVGNELLQEIGLIEKLLKEDEEPLARLFEALDHGEANVAERLRDELVTRGAKASRRLKLLEQHVKNSVDQLVDSARARERSATHLQIALFVVTLLVSGSMAAYAARVLRPLGSVTERAKAVARGDLQPRQAVVSHDEIGELSQTFEGMVAAIARANEQLILSERLAAVGKMAAHVTHEIRNPLSSIALNLELLEEELGENADEARTLLRAIRQEVDRLTALSEQYLSFGRRQSVRLEMEELSDLAREVAEFLKRELAAHRTELKLDLPSSRVMVRVDEPQIKQALLNLIRNAREAMPEGGQIVLRVRGKAAGGAQIAVEDNGPGMEEAVRARAFEPFFSTKHQGTGLGLAIVRQIVEAHGGKVHCEARQPSGTSVQIELPAAEAQFAVADSAPWEAPRTQAE